jgi:hypothetical protein
MQYNPLLLDEYSRRDPTVLGCVFTSARRLMEYQITFNGKEVIAERLLQRVGDTEKPWFERRAPRRTEIYPENFPGELSINLEGVTRANAAVISTAAHLAQEPLLDIFNSIRSSLRVLICTPVIASLPYSLQRWKDDPDFRNWILNTLLRRADIGIRDIKVEKRRIPDDIIDHMRKLMPEGSPPPPEILEPVFSHEGENDVYSLEFDTQSTGTQKLVAIAGPWYDVIRGRKTLFVDELSSSLHPNLLEALLEALNPSKDAPHAQIVFTLHDPTPLQEVLRRDQVYFTEKDKFGRASLFSLANFKERQVSNLRKRYLEGRYGAIPHLGKFDFLKEPEEVE